MGRKSRGKLARQRRQLRQIQTVELSTSFSGPLPPPAQLKEYDNVVPGAAERIIALAENQSGHRQALEKQVVSGGVTRERNGQMMGFVVAMTGMLGGFYLIATGFSWIGISTIIANLTAFTTVFVVGRHSQRIERQEKHARFVRRASR